MANLIALLITGNIIFLILFLINRGGWRSTEKEGQLCIKNAQTTIDAKEERVKQIKKERDETYGWADEEIKKITKERDEMRQIVINKILSKLGPLIEETTIESLAELGANKRAQRLADNVIQKLKKELGFEKQ